MECECPEHNAPAAGYSSSGLPIDEHGAILTHLCTRQQLRDIETALRLQRERVSPPGWLMRKQAGG
jgi:hypothetical protein